MINNISQSLFSTTPTQTLYHYTSLSGLLGIVQSRHLRASDVRFMNDSAELRHTLELLRGNIEDRLGTGTDHPALMTAMLEWLGHRGSGSAMIFAASFRANGNLLSQWRGYSAHGKGVSIGFAAEHVLALAQKQGFQVARCLYDPSEQATLIEQIIEAVEAHGAAVDIERAPNFPAIFEAFEEDLMRIAAVLKHPAFEEEEEWRIVSPRIVNLRAHPVSFREGASMLVPYYRFDLAAGENSGLVLDHVYIGPTGNSELSRTSVALFLENHDSSPRLGVSECSIPYRRR